MFTLGSVRSRFVCPWVLFILGLFVLYLFFLCNDFDWMTWCVKFFISLSVLTKEANILNSGTYWHVISPIIHCKPKKNLIWYCTYNISKYVWYHVTLVHFKPSSCSNMSHRKFIYLNPNFSLFWPVFWLLQLFP